MRSQRYEWRRILDVHPSRAFGWLHPQLLSVCNFMRPKLRTSFPTTEPSQTREPWERAKNCYLKPLNFGNVSYAAINNRNGMLSGLTKYLWNESTDWWINLLQMFYSIFSSTTEIYINKSGPISKLNQNWLNHCTGLFGETKTLGN